MLQQSGQGFAGAHIAHEVPGDTVLRQPDLDKAQPIADLSDGRVGAQEQPAAYARVVTEGLDERCQITAVETGSTPDGRRRADVQSGVVGNPAHGPGGEQPKWRRLSNHSKEVA